MSPLRFALIAAAVAGLAAWRIVLVRRRTAAMRAAREKATQEALKAARRSARDARKAAIPATPSRAEVESARAAARAKAARIVAAEAARRQAGTQQRRTPQDESDRRAAEAAAALAQDSAYAPTERMSLDELVPDAPAEPPAAAPAPARRPILHKVPKSVAQTLVMVVDDSKMVRLKASRLLEANGYQVITAVDGLDALAQLETSLPDLVITDIDMPGMDGFGLVNALRINPATRRIPLVMITSAEGEHRDAAYRAGVGLVLGKPYDEAALLAHLRSKTFMTEVEAPAYS